MTNFDNQTQNLIQALNIDKIVQPSAKGTLRFNGRDTSMPLEAIQDSRIVLDIHEERKCFVTSLELILGENCSIFISFSPFKNCYVLTIQRDNEILDKENVFDASCEWIDKSVVSKDGALLFCYDTSSIVSLPTSVKSITRDSIPLNNIEVLDLNMVETLDVPFLLATDVRILNGGKSLKSVKAGAFLGAEKLEHVILPPSVQELEPSCFWRSSITRTGIQNFSTVPITPDLFTMPSPDIDLLSEL